MSFSAWLHRLESAEKTSLLTRDVRKIHYKFPDGGEMAEEYNLATGVVARRAWRSAQNLTKGPSAEWTLELGDTVRELNPSAEQFVVKESLTEPILSKRVTRVNLEWRIRNLPYALQTYEVAPFGVDEIGERRYAIVVRTTNKKYYKVIPVVELQRCETVPQASNITVQHQSNTLIITVRKSGDLLAPTENRYIMTLSLFCCLQYKKPAIMVEMERAVLLMLQNVETERDLDADCNKLMQQLMGSAAHGASGDA